MCIESFDPPAIQPGNLSFGEANVLALSQGWWQRYFLRRDCRSSSAVCPSAAAPESPTAYTRGVSVYISYITERALAGLALLVLPRRGGVSLFLRISLGCRPTPSASRQFNAASSLLSASPRGVRLYLSSRASSALTSLAVPRVLHRDGVLVHDRFLNLFR